MNNDDMTHFGFQQIQRSDKSAKVADVFHSVASSYDVMNDLMSLGLHRIWKRIAINYCQVRAGQHILDVAGGSGDLSIHLVREMSLASMLAKKGKIVLADINASMLKVARTRILNQGLHEAITLIQADAENLPFPNDYFDRIIIGFGLRNVTDKESALASMCRVLKPGGRLVILEFSQTTVPLLKQMYDFYSFKGLPLLGRLIANDATSYQYLAESIRMHPNADILKQMMHKAGFDEVEYHYLLGGIVAIHIGVKL